jgi:hypothetical protein
MKRTTSLQVCLFLLAFAASHDSAPAQDGAGAPLPYRPLSLPAARFISDFRQTLFEGSPEMIAEHLIRSDTHCFRVPSSSALTHSETIFSLNDKHVVFQQSFLGYPVEGALINISIDKLNRVVCIYSSLIERDLLVSPPVLTQQEAFTRALAYSGDTDPGARQFGGAQLRIVLDEDSTAHLCWKLEYFSAHLHIPVQAHVSSLTGNIISFSRYGSSYGDGEARVFRPDPVTKLNNSTLSYTDSIPVNAYFQPALLRDLNDADTNGKYSLSGRYAESIDGWMDINNSLSSPPPVTKTDRNFYYYRSEAGFAEANAYWFLDFHRRYIGFLGFEPKFGIPPVDAIKYDAHSAIDQLDAAYHPSDGTNPEYIGFGYYHVATAEDQDIVIHEYTHAVHDYLLAGPWFNIGGDENAIAEGSADYCAISFRSTISNHMPGRVFPWAMNDNEQLLNQSRYVDHDLSKNLYPVTWNNGYAGGTIWACALWDLEENSGWGIGRDFTTALLLKSFSYVLPGVLCPEHLRCLMIASREHFDSKQLPSIGYVFERRGFFKERSINGQPVHDTHYLSGTQTQNTIWSDMYWLDHDLTLSANHNFSIDGDGFFYVGPGNTLILEPGVNFNVYGRIVVYENARILVKNGATLSLLKSGSLAGVVILRGGSLECEGNGALVVEDGRGLRGSGSLVHTSIAWKDGWNMDGDQVLNLYDGGVFSFDPSITPQYIIDRGAMHFHGGSNPYEFGYGLTEIRVCDNGLFQTESGAEMRNLPTVISWDAAQLRSFGEPDVQSYWLFREGAGLDDYTSLLAVYTTFAGTPRPGTQTDEWEGILVGSNGWIDLDYCVVADIHADLASGGTGIHLYQSGSVLNSIKHCRIFRGTTNANNLGDGIFLQPGSDYSFVSVQCTDISEDWSTGFTFVGGAPPGNARNTELLDSHIHDNLIGVGLVGSAALEMQRCCIENNAFYGADVSGAGSCLSFTLNGIPGDNRIVDNALAQLSLRDNASMFGGWYNLNLTRMEGIRNNISRGSKTGLIASFDNSTAFIAYDWFGLQPDPWMLGWCTFNTAPAYFSITNSTVWYNPTYCAEVVSSCASECAAPFHVTTTNSATLSKVSTLPPFASSMRDLRSYAQAGNFAEIYRFIAQTMPGSAPDHLVKRLASILLQLEHEHVALHPDSLSVSRERLNAFLLARLAATNQPYIKAALLNVLARSLFAFNDILGAEYRIGQLRAMYPTSPYASDILPIMQLVAMAQRDSVKMNTAIGLMQSANMPADAMRLAHAMKRAYLRYKPESPYPKAVSYHAQEADPVRTPSLTVTNYPNPFNPSTLIEYYLPNPGEVSLRVFDLLGRQIAQLVHEPQTAGMHSVAFTSGLSMPSGVYLYVLSTPFGNVSGKMTLIR